MLQIGFFEWINSIKESKKKEFESVLKSLVEEGLLLKSEVDKILNGSTKLETLRTEELIWIYQKMINIHMTDIPLDYYFSKIELVNSENVKQKISLDKISKWCYLQRNIYNLDRKIQFFKDVYGEYDEISVKDKINVFNRIGVIENELEGDLCDFNEDQLYLLLSRLNLLTVGTFMTVKTYLVAYANWCYKQGYIIENNLSLFTELVFSKIDNSESFRQHYFKDLNDVRGYIDMVRHQVNPTELDRYDTPIAILYLAWAGLTNKEATELKITDVNTSQGFITVNNHSVGFDDLGMLDFLKRYGKETHYTNLKTKKMIEYGNNTYLLRTSIKGKLNVNTVRISLYNFYKITSGLPENNRYFNMIVNYSSISKSGLYYRMKKYEEINGELTCKDAKVIKGLTNKNYKDTFKIQYLLDEYHQWRRYFYGE